MTIKYDYRYGSITPEDVIRSRHFEFHVQINTEIMIVLDNEDLSQAQKTEEIKAIVNRPIPPAFDLDYAIAARDGAKARHDTPVVKLWEQEIWRLKGIS